uniref:Tail fiber protein n=1 Tax=Burkholderia phage vB_BgluM-SURPRISE13 TaxID=3159457 RepID=A0AAU7PF87_9VIRU
MLESMLVAKSKGNLTVGTFSQMTLPLTGTITAAEYLNGTWLIGSSIGEILYGTSLDNLTRVYDATNGSSILSFVYSHGHWYAYAVNGWYLGLALNALTCTKLSQTNLVAIGNSKGVQANVRHSNGTGIYYNVSNLDATVWAYTAQSPNGGGLTSRNFGATSLFSFAAEGNTSWWSNNNSNYTVINGVTQADLGTGSPSGETFVSFLETGNLTGSDEGYTCDINRAYVLPQTPYNRWKILNSDGLVKGSGFTVGFFKNSYVLASKAAASTQIGFTDPALVNNRYPAVVQTAPIGVTGDQILRAVGGSTELIIVTKTKDIYRMTY